MPKAGKPRGLHRTNPGFFSRPSTARTIEAIASQEDLVIYVGAGVSMVDTGASWGTLMSHLLKQVEGLSEDDRHRLSQSLQPLELASLIWHNYKKQFTVGDNDPIGVLADNIAALIYRQNQWKLGDYVRATMILCDTLVRGGTHVRILTTNYDYYLEMAAERESQIIDGTGALFSSTWALSDIPADAPRKTLDESSPDNSRRVSITHLHGVILPQNYRVTERIPLVFSEKHYHLHQEDTVRTITNAIRDKPVLILGSSLTDPPLLQALAQTSGQRWSIYPRAAARPSLEPYRVDFPNTSNDLMERLADRAKEFDVELITPDFFCQAAQFLREVSHAKNLISNGSCYATSSPTTHDARLKLWWDCWAIQNLPDLEKAQAAHSLRLHEVLGEVKLATGDPDERMKIDLWVRWKPMGRNLQLWASSTGTWPDHTIARRVPIEATSNYAAVEAFSQGHVLLRQTQGRSDRWNRYLAIPIRQDAVVDSQVVGVITLATANNNQNTKLSDSEPAVLLAVSLLLRGLGREMLLDAVSLD